MPKGSDIHKKFTQDGIYMIVKKMKNGASPASLIVVEDGELYGLEKAEMRYPDALKKAAAHPSVFIKRLDDEPIEGVTDESSERVYESWLSGTLGAIQSKIRF